MRKYAERAKMLLAGAYDLHVHTGLDYRPRSVDDVELLREADQYHMAGVIIKNHYEPTQARAYLANKYAGTKTVAYGSITLNNTIGGLNPYAVENALRQDARMVWMPTMDSTLAAALKLGQQFEVRKAVSIYKDDGTIRDEVYDIFDLVKQYGVPIASGHLNPNETLDFCDAALKEKAKVIMTHPDWPKSTIPVHIQREYADKGVLIEKVFWYMAPFDMCQSARDVGIGRVFFVTDRGQMGQKTPTAALLEYVENMLDFGMTDDEIRSLIIDVPQKVLGKE